MNPIFDSINLNTPDAEPISTAMDDLIPATISKTEWMAVRELTALNSTVIRTILQILASNPMVAPMLGPEFTADATRVESRIGVVLEWLPIENDINGG